METGASTGRRCDGYEPLPSTKTQPKFVTVVPTAVPTAVRREESRSLQFFHEKTLSQLTSFFQDEFWTRQVLQVADSDKCIRHSLVALASYHELFTARAGSSRQNQFALRHYNLSIGGVLSSKKASVDAHSPLMSCVLFILGLARKAVQGHIPTVLQLVKAGYRMLKEQPTSSRTQHGPGRRPSYSNDVDSVIEYTYSFLRRLIGQIFMLIGDLDPELSSIVSELLQVHEAIEPFSFRFESLGDAQEELGHIRMQLERGPSNALPEKMKAWQVAFQDLKTCKAEALDNRADKRALALLELQARFCAVDVAINCADGRINHLLWDHYTEDFSRMLDFAEEAMEWHPPRDAADDATPRFHMHSGTVPALYGIIAKCRDPAIRRRAVAMMLSRPLQEGVWNSNLVLGVGRRIMATEEGSEGTLLPVSSSRDIPAESRVRTIAVAAGAGRDRDQYMVGYQLGRGWWWENATHVSSGHT